MKDFYKKKGAYNNPPNPTPPTDDNLEDSFHSAGDSEPGDIMAVEYDTANDRDGEGAEQKASNIKLQCNPKKLQMWFQILENKMQFCQIKSQWLKLQTLTSLLPTELLDHIEAFAALPQAQAGATCYLQAKKRLLDIYGQKPEECYDLATGLMMSSTPSELARRIVDLVCENKLAPLVDCCGCAKMAFGIWRKKLPASVRQGLGCSTFENGTWEDTLGKADAIYRNNAATTAQVAEVVDQQADAAVSAVGRGQPYRGRGRGARGRGRGGRGRGQGQRPQQPRQEKETVPEACCPQHKRYGREAYYCMNILTCPWKSSVKPPTSASNGN